MKQNYEKNPQKENISNGEEGKYEAIKPDGLKQSHILLQVALSSGDYTQEGSETLINPDREATIEKIKSGEADGGLAMFLLKIKTPIETEEDRNNPTTIFSSVRLSKQMCGFIADEVGGGLQKRDEVKPSDITKLVKHYPDPRDLEKQVRSYIKNIENDEQKKENEKEINKLLFLLYGERKAYADQIELLKNPPPKPEQRPEQKEMTSEGREEFDHFDAIATNRLDRPTIVQGRHGKIGFGTDEGINYPIKENQDGIVINTEKDAFAVVDAMGGMANGEQAKNSILEELQGGFQNNDSPQTIQKNAYENMKRSGVGSGGAAYVSGKIEGNTLKIAWAGDVRLIIVREGKVVYQTQDQSTPRGLWNAVTGTEAGNTKEEEQKLLRGYRILCASDGLWKNFTSEEVAEMVKGLSIEKALAVIEQKLREKMEADGKPDHRSLIIYDYEE